jgi:poly(hydroxyalkanoate) granule-associated protein
MATKNGDKPQLIQVEEEEPRTAGGPRQLLRVGLGMISYGNARLEEAQERFEALFEELVERGEALEKDGRQMLEEVMKNRRQDAEKRQEEAEARLDRMLNRFNVPTRKDIQALNDELATLNKKVDELKKMTAA